MFRRILFVIFNLRSFGMPMTGFRVFFLILFISNLGISQDQSSFFELSDSFSKPRFWTAVGTSSALYTGTVIGLNEIWYKGFDRSPFHPFNDWNEWKNMDKAGHAFTAYFQTSFSFDVMRWTGVKRRNALWVSMGLATLFQGTIEVLDGYSEKWGFSIYDIGFNTAGILLFAGQELAWEDQRFVLKISNRFINSNSGDATSSPAQRARNLFGKGPTTRFIKDYNGQTIWLSMNPSSFLKEDTKFPKWLNVAIGYGAENLYGGYGNSWSEDNQNFFLPTSQYQRASQMFLSFDIDLKRIETKKPFLRFLLKGLNVFKIPSPTLSLTQGQGLKFHAIYW